MFPYHPRLRTKYENMRKKEDKMNSIGIIGGADGPTAIFVTGGLSPWMKAAAALIVVAAAVGAFLIYRKIKNKK